MPTGTPFQGEIEVDESYFGAKRIKGKRGRGAGGKTPVFGILQRAGNVYTEIVPDCAGRHYRPLSEAELNRTVLFIIHPKINNHKRKEKCTMTSRIKIVLVAILCCIMLSSCTTTVNVKKDLVFKQRPEIIQKTVALYISQDTQQFKRLGKHAGGKCIIQFGQSLAPNAQSSLRKVFSEVITLSSKDAQSLSASGADYLIELQINDNTSVQVGAATFSAHTAIVSLKCIAIEPKDDALLFQEDIQVEKVKHPGAAGFVPCFFINQRTWEKNLQSAVDESMQEALEKVNDLLLTNREKFK